MSDRHRLAKFRFLLPDNQIVDDIYAHSEAEACIELERLKPGLSGQVLKLERDDLYFLRDRPVSQGARR